MVGNAVLGELLELSLSTLLSPHEKFVHILLIILNSFKEGKSFCSSIQVPRITTHFDALLRGLVGLGL